MPDEKQVRAGVAYRRKLHINAVKEGSEPRYVKILHNNSWNNSQVPLSPAYTFNILVFLQENNKDPTVTTLRIRQRRQERQKTIRFLS